MTVTTKIFSRKFKVKHFRSKFSRKKRKEEVVEFDNFFKFRFDWDPKYHFELFMIRDPQDQKKYLTAYFTIACPPVLLKNFTKFQLKLSTLNSNYEKCCTKEWTIQFENNQSKGWYRFLSADEIFSKEAGLLKDDKLTLCCEIRAIEEDF